MIYRNNETDFHLGIFLIQINQQLCGLHHIYKITKMVIFVAYVREQINKRIASYLHSIIVILWNVNINEDCNPFTDGRINFFSTGVVQFDKLKEQRY